MDDKLEDRIREALRRRAEEAPAGGGLAAVAEARSRRARAPLAAAAVVAIIVGAAGVAAIQGPDPGVEVRTPATGGAQGAERAQPSAASADRPLLGFDTPGFKFERVEECEGDPAEEIAQAERARPLLQSFGPGRDREPLLFLQTVTAQQRKSFGLVTPETGEAFPVRGSTGYASRDRDGRAWTVSLELPDGRALYSIVLGLDLDDVAGIIDELQPRGDGGWTSPVMPDGMRELPTSEVWGGCAYSAVARVGMSGTPIEVRLSNDRFDSRLADRVASTAGTVHAIDVDGVRGVTGAYDDAATDHWLLFEPSPGRTMEIRASGISRAELGAIASSARFVDEPTWRSMHP